MSYTFNPLSGQFDFYKDATPAGSDQEIQFNDSGVLGADAGLKFDKTNKTLLIGDPTVSGQRTIKAADSTTTNIGGYALLVNGANGKGTADGGSLSMAAGSADTSGNGGTTYISAGDAVSAGNGGGVELYGGMGAGAGTDGKVKILDPSSSIYAVFDTSGLASTDKTFTFPNTTGTIALTSDVATKAPVSSAFVTIGTDATLTSERSLTGTSNQIVVTDNGAGSTVVLSTPQDINTSSSPTFAALTLAGDITDGGTAARSWTMARHTTSNTAGNTLTIQAGGSTVAATDKNGGTLILKGGTPTGTGTSQIQFFTTPALTVGGIKTIASAPTAGGTGYTAGDTLTVTTGDGTATVTVSTVSGGVITAMTTTPVNAGSGYSTGTGQATSGGTGTGATINVTAITSTSDGTSTQRVTVLGSGNVGIGDTNPGNKLTINTTAANDGAQVIYSGASSASVTGTFQVGTNDGAAMSVNDRIGQFGFVGNDGSVLRQGPSILCVATETWSSTARGSKYTFFTIGNTTITQAAALTLEQDQSATIGTNIQLTGNIADGGNAARDWGLNRITTAASAGSSLTFHSAGSTSGSTDKAGGDLILAKGVNTGTGRGNIRLQSHTVALSTGTGNGTAFDANVVDGFLALTNNTVVAVVNATLANNTAVGLVLDYAIEVFNGTDVQVEVGSVSFMETNKGGAFAGNTALKFGNQQTTTAGTLAVTWTITAANPAVISVNANSSLTPSAGYPRLRYNIRNLTGQAIAIQ